MSDKFYNEHYDNIGFNTNDPIETQHRVKEHDKYNETLSNEDRFYEIEIGLKSYCVKVG